MRSLEDWDKWEGREYIPVGRRVKERERGKERER